MLTIIIYSVRPFFRAPGRTEMTASINTDEFENARRSRDPRFDGRSSLAY